MIAARYYPAAFREPDNVARRYGCQPVMTFKEQGALFLLELFAKGFAAFLVFAIVGPLVAAPFVGLWVRGLGIVAVIGAGLLVWAGVAAYRWFRGTGSRRRTAAELAGLLIFGIFLIIDGLILLF